MDASRPEIAIVVRFTRYEGVGPSDCVSLMSAFVNLADAEAEAARLNGVRRSDKVEYFVQMLLARSAESAKALRLIEK